MLNYIACSPQQVEALSTAFNIQHDDFFHQTALVLSDGFMTYFPPSRPDEPLSGLWDHFDREGLGYHGTGYRPARAEISSWKGGGVIQFEDPDIDVVISLIAHVCSNKLPVALIWPSYDQQGNMIQGAGNSALLTNKGVIYSNGQSLGGMTAAQCKLFERIARKAFKMAEGWVRAGDRSANVSKSVEYEIWAYVPDPRKKRPSLARELMPALAHKLAIASAGRVEGCYTWPEGGHGVQVFSSSPLHTLHVLKRALLGMRCPRGTQVQYEVVEGSCFDECHDDAWREGLLSGGFDGGRALYSLAA